MALKNDTISFQTTEDDLTLVRSEEFPLEAVNNLRRNSVASSLALARYSRIACQLEVGTPFITFAVEIQFQIRDQF